MDANTCEARRNPAQKQKEENTILQRVNSFLIRMANLNRDEEGQTLTEISHRMQRTPGSTKDYLSWLEDVDLVASTRKRYSFCDALLRLWVRLHCRGAAPAPEDLAREVHRYAAPRLPPEQPEPALAMAAVGAGEDEKKAWGIIEID